MLFAGGKKEKKLKRIVNNNDVINKDTQLS